MIFLSSSSFFLSDYLTDKLKNNSYTASQFNFALEQGYSVALNIEEEKHKLGSLRWLEINKILANYQSKSALKLGKWHKNIWYQQQGLNQPNESLISKSFYSAKTWLEHSIYLGSTEAIFSLASLYYDDKKFHLSRILIKQYPSSHDASKIGVNVLILRIKLAIYFGDVELIKQLLQNHKQTRNNADLYRLFGDIIKYDIVKKELVKSDIKPINKPKAELNKVLVNLEQNKVSPNKVIKVIRQDKREFSSDCISSLQLLATSLEHLKHLETLINAFNKQNKLSQFMCLPTPKYISKKLIECDTKENQPIICDEVKWQYLPTNIQSRHLGLMLEQGGANVYLGMLYFDAEDDVNVFSHEVSHLLGFVDEYPLSKNHQACQDVQEKRFAHNVTVLKSYYQGDESKVRKAILKHIPWADDIAITTPIMTAEKTLNGQKRWRLGTPDKAKGELGVYPAETCQNAVVMNHETSSISPLNFGSFKPLSRRTQLRYNESEFPTEYLNMIKNRPFTYLMPSYHYNVALAFYQQGDVENAAKWLQKASSWEVDPVRKATILQGAF